MKNLTKQEAEQLNKDILSYYNSYEDNIEDLISELVYATDAIYDDEVRDMYNDITNEIEKKFDIDIEKFFDILYPVYKKSKDSKKNIEKKVIDISNVSVEDLYDKIGLLLAYNSDIPLRHIKLLSDEIYDYIDMYNNDIVFITDVMNESDDMIENLVYYFTDQLEQILDM